MLSAPPFKHRWMMFLLCHGVVHNNCNRSDLHLQLHSTTHQKRKKKSYIIKIQVSQNIIWIFLMRQNLSIGVFSLVAV